MSRIKARYSWFFLRIKAFGLILAIGFILAGCHDIDKIKDDAYHLGYQAGKSDGYEEGVTKRYADLANEFYSHPSKFSFNKKTYKSKIDTKKIVKKLERNRKEDIDNIVLDLNTDILEGLSVKLGLDKQQKIRAFDIYNENHPMYASQYFNQYEALCNDKDLNRSPRALINFTVHDRADALSEVMANQLCATMGFVIGLLSLEFPTSNIAGIMAGKPCEELSAYLLKPITNQLLESGFLQDIQSSKSSIETKASKMIVELATMEKQYHSKIEADNTTKTFWGLFSSTASASASYNGIIKAGFNLGEKLRIDVDYASRRIRIHLGRPKIFDPIIYPNLEKIENGWFSKIDANTINRMHLQATREILQLAEDDRILDEAETNAHNFLMMLFEPIAKIPPVPFDVQILSGTSGKEIQGPGNI